MNVRDYADIIKRNVSTDRVARQIGLKVNRAGFCKCPFHPDKTASLKIYPGDRGWHCFGCHAGGSVIDLVMQYYGTDLRGAIEIINDDFNLRLPIGRTVTRAEEEAARKRAEERKREEEARKAEDREQYEAFLRWCDIGKELIDLEADKVLFAPKSPDDP